MYGITGLDTVKKGWEGEKETEQWMSKQTTDPGYKLWDSSVDIELVTGIWILYPTTGARKNQK